MLGDPVSQHGQHPHGGRRARDGHLPLGRLTERVTGGFLKHETLNRRILRSLSQSFIFLTIFGRSRGLLEPAVAAAKATAAGAKLDLQCFNANKGRLVLVHPFHSNTGM